jgi:protein HOOK3
MFKLQRELEEAEKQLLELKKKLIQTEAELSVTKKELDGVKSDCLFTLPSKQTYHYLALMLTSTYLITVSLVGKDDLEALAELKARNSVELVELQKEYDEAQAKIRELEREVDQKKSLLNTVLLEKDEISKKVSEQKDLMLEKEKSNSELKATIAAFEGTADGRDSALEKRVLQLQNKLEDRREKMTKSREVRSLIFQLTG